MLYIPDMSKKSETSATVREQGILPYGAFFAFLALYTTIEAVIFLNRDNWALSAKILVPVLLALTLIKFILVVGWFLYGGQETRWFEKIMIASLVIGGASGLIMHLLMNPTIF